MPSAPTATQHRRPPHRQQLNTDDLRTDNSSPTIAIEIIIHQVRIRQPRFFVRRKCGAHTTALFHRYCKCNKFNATCIGVQTPTYPSRSTQHARNRFDVLIRRLLHILSPLRTHAQGPPTPNTNATGLVASMADMSDRCQHVMACCI